MRSIPVPDPIEREGHYFCPVEGCSRTEKGYKTSRGYREHYQTAHCQSVRVGFHSRIDFGSPGYRKGLLDLASQIFTQEKVNFINLAGGLVSFNHLKKLLPKGKGESAESKRSALLNQWTKKLATAIPQLRDERGKPVKIYIVTSPAPNYDGWLGAEIARRLTKGKRRDIRFWGEASAWFRIKRLNLLLWVLTPLKAAWRSKYFSTAVDRLIEDKERQTSQNLPDLWVVGCPASTLQRPKGERKRPYISVPALHRLEEVHTAENQEGVTVVEFYPQSNEFAVRNYDFKTLVARELDGIAEPAGPDTTELQRQVVRQLKAHWTRTVGELEEDLRKPRHFIEEAVKKLSETGFEPKIIYDEAEERFAFDRSWIQDNLTYNFPPLETLSEDAILAFACLHATAPFTEYHFFTEEVPELILRHEITTLVGAGDFLEGLEHNLDKRGEVIFGLNYTQQEIIAAKLVGSVIVRVFRARFKEALPKGNNNNHKLRISQAKLQDLVDQSLLTFLYREGNHDAWQKKYGVTPLETFHARLVGIVAQGVEEVLGEFGLQLPLIRTIVEKKIKRGEQHTLPSGLCLGIYHPNMARCLTSSLRAQQTLEASDCQIAVSGNFHVATAVNQWDSDHGQRVSLQVGTLLWQSTYEHERLKRLDTGVGILRVLSSEGRIYMTETLLTGEGTRKETFTQDDALRLLEERLGI